MARHHGLPAILFLLASLVGPVGAFAADIVVPPTEAPTSIFSTRLGSMDVDLSLLGSWTAAASFGTGILLAPGLPAQALDAFPSIDQGFIFSQTPDITISLDLFKRFFLNVSVVGSFANNSIQLGYRGQPGEVIRSVVLGTQGITIAPSQLMQIPGPAPRFAGRHGGVRFRQFHERRSRALGCPRAEDQVVRGKERAGGAGNRHQLLRAGTVLLPAGHGAGRGDPPRVPGGPVRNVRRR